MRKVKVTQVRSVIGRLKSHKAAVQWFGASAHTAFCGAGRYTSSVRGMMSQVNYLLQVEEV